MMDLRLSAIRKWISFKYNESAIQELITTRNPIQTMAITSLSLKALKVHIRIHHLRIENIVKWLCLSQLCSL